MPPQAALTRMAPSCAPRGPPRSDPSVSWPHSMPPAISIRTTITGASTIRNTSVKRSCTTFPIPLMIWLTTKLHRRTIVLLSVWRRPSVFLHRSKAEISWDSASKSAKTTTEFSTNSAQSRSNISIHIWRQGGRRPPEAPHLPGAKGAGLTRGCG